MKNQTIEISKDLNLTYVPEVSQLEIIMELASQHPFWVKPVVIRHSDMIDSRIIEENWTYEPLVDESIIPKSARKRVDLILKYINPQGFIIGHEIEVKPKVKPLPWVVAPEQEPWKPRVREIWEKTGKKINWGLVWTITWNIIKIAGLTCLILMAALGALIGCMFDPVVICCTQEGEWVRIYRYY